MASFRAPASSSAPVYVQQSSSHGNCIGIEELIDIICESLEACIHTILYAKHIYPKEIFDKRQLLNVPVWRSRNSDLNDYISSALSSFRIWFKQRNADAVSVMIIDQDSSEILEHYIFRFELPSQTAAEPSMCPLIPLETFLRRTLLKFSNLDSLVAPIDSGPQGLRFNIALHTHKDLESVEWVQCEEAEEWCGIPPSASSLSAASASSARSAPTSRRLFQNSASSSAPASQRREEQVEAEEEEQHDRIVQPIHSFRIPGIFAMQSTVEKPVEDDEAEQ